MAKRNITAEVMAYLKENIIDRRIGELREEIVALQSVRRRMFPDSTHPKAPVPQPKKSRKKPVVKAKRAYTRRAPVVKKPKRKLSPAHKLALARGRAEWAARKKQKAIA